MSGYLAAFKLEWLAMALLATAAATAFSARRTGFFARWLAMPIVVGGFGVWALAALGLAIVLRFVLHTYPHWLYHDAARAVAFVAGAIVVIRRGRRRTGPEPDAPRAAAGWPLGKLVAAAAVAAAVWGLTLWAFYCSAAWALESARREAPALAWSAAPPAVPDAENAAGIYQRVSSLLPERQKMPDSDRMEYYSWADLRLEMGEPNPKMLAFLKEREPALTLLHQAAALSECRFAPDYEHPRLSGFTSELFSHAAEFRSLLMIDVRAKCAQGDVRGALRDVAILRALVRHLAQEPSRMNLSLSMSMESSSSFALEYVLSRTSPSVEDLAAVPPNGRFSLEERLQPTLRIEEAVGLAEIANIEATAFDQTRITGNEPIAARLFGKPSFRLALVGWRTFYLTRDLADYQTRMDRAQVLSTRPYREARDEWDRWDDDFRGKPHGSLTGMLLPGTEILANKTCSADARAHLADLALAAAAYRAKNGRYPTKPEELVPEFLPALPADPFDGQPLRMRAVANGIVLYSVGDDLRDDGGEEMDYRKHTGDLTFCLGAKLWRERRAKKN